MPSNKEALIRYRTINRCLINHKVCSKDKLLQVCSEAVGHPVAWRTLADDIRAMRKDEQLGFFAPIKNIKNQGYTYEDPNYSIDDIPLNEEELEAIKIAANLLSQYKGVDIFSTFGGAMEKIADRVNLKLQEHQKGYMSFEASTADGGSKHVLTISEQIKHRVALNLRYFSFSSRKEKSFTFHPYFIKEYRGRWYVVGYHEAYSNLRVLALERILQLEPNYHTSYRINQMDFSKYFDDIIGISLEGEAPEDITLRLTPKDYQFIESQPIHASQKVLEKTDDYVVIQIHLRVNYELKSLILSLGPGVQVIAPTKLREEILQLHQKAIEMYI
jgi:predicted DNA-binding transcriptional regulator YafY